MLGVKSVKIISIDLLLLNKIGFSNLKKIKQFFLSFVKKLFIKRIPLSKGIKLFLSFFLKLNVVLYFEFHTLVH